MTARYECPETGCQFEVQAHTDSQLSAMVEKHVRDRHAGVVSGERHVRDPRGE